MTSSVTSRITFANVSVPQIPKGHPRSSPRVSRVTFAAASNKGGSSASPEELKTKAVEFAGDAKGALDEKMLQAQKQASEFTETVVEKAQANLQGVKEKAQEAAEALSEKTKDASNEAALKAEETKEATIELAEKGGNETAKAVQGAWEAAKGISQKPE